MSATHYEADQGDKVLVRVDLIGARMLLDAYERWLDTGQGMATDLSVLVEAASTLRKFYQRHAGCAHCASYETTYENGVAYCSEHIQLSAEEKADQLRFDSRRRKTA
jgi:NADH pyrophosphatase NudC (nudix superfamily)